MIKHVFETAAVQKGKWRQYLGRQKIAGVHHYRHAATKFIHGAIRAEKQGLPYGLEVKPEPANPYDPNALAIIAHWNRKRLFSAPLHISDHIGYVAADMAEDIANMRPRPPVAARLLYAYIGNDGYVDIEYSLLLPGIKSGFWQGHTHPWAR